MKLNEKQIAALEQKGFRRWTKGNMDRLYINAETLGLEYDRFKSSGRVSYAVWRGERISNRWGNEMANAKTYIDIANGKLYATESTLEEAAQELYQETMEALEAAETDEKEENIMSNNYAIKEKIVKSGNSRVFNAWHENADITMEAFLDGLRWLCDDPMPDARLTRELGCIRRAGAGMTPEQIEQFGIPEQREGVARLYRLTRAYDKNGKFLGFYDETGHIWGHSADCASLSARDRV